MPIPKLATGPASIFSIMSALATEVQAINLGQGFPDFLPDPALLNAVKAAVDAGFHQYNPSPGLPRLRELIAARYDQQHGLALTPNEVTITPGASYAIRTALDCMVRPGQEVVVLEPCYDSYVPAIEVNGAKAVRVNSGRADFGVDWSLVQAAITERTVGIIINTPNNPSGRLFTHEDFVALQTLAEQHDLFVVSDEVYEALVFDGQKHLSVLDYPGLMARSFACYSFGKTYHCTGWKIGYCIAPESLTQAFRQVHQFNAFCTNTPLQHALANYLETDETHLHLRAAMAERRNFLRSGLKALGWQPVPSSGSYFECYHYHHLSSEPDAEFARRLTLEAGLATIPVSAFYEKDGPQLLRFCFAKKEETLQAALERLERWQTQKSGY